MRELDELDARVDEILNRRPVVGLIVGVVRDGRLEFVYRHGLADIASHAADRRPPLACGDDLCLEAATALEHRLGIPAPIDPTRLVLPKGDMDR
jgi:hypothetical protein